MKKTLIAVLMGMVLSGSVVFGEESLRFRQPEVSQSQVPPLFAQYRRMRYGRRYRRVYVIRPRYGWRHRHVYAFRPRRRFYRRR